MKAYSPFQISNPQSNQHIARLKPGQFLQLTLGKDRFPNAELVLDSEELTLEGEGEDKAEKQFLISHSDDAKKWADYSSLFLGEVWIRCDQEDKAKILVYVESPNKFKKDIITVINPNWWDVRLRPWEMLEVVLYDHSFKTISDWDWNFFRCERVTMDMLGHEDIVLYVREQFGDYFKIDPDYRYTILPRTEHRQNTEMPETHMWFRFDATILDLLIKSGTVLIGNMNFEGTKDPYENVVENNVQYGFTLYVDCYKKHQARTIQSLGLPGYADSQTSTLFDTTAADDKVVARVGNKYVVHKEKNKKRVREVTFNRLFPTMFSDGCRVLTRRPENDQTVQSLQTFKVN